MSALKQYKFAIAANLIAICLALAYVASMAVPASEATRIRNAFLIEVVGVTDIEWTPDRVPIEFKKETLPPSAMYADVVHRLGIAAIEGDWDKALFLAGHLSRNAKDLGAIQSNLEATYHAIVDEGRGYCADFTAVYLGLAHASGLFAREWAFSLDGFGGHGHAFIEIFDRQRGRWIWLDVYNNVHAVDAITQEPLSAAEFRAYVRGERGAAVVRANGPGRLGYKYTDKLVDYYRRGSAEWYLWAGNAVFTYESHSFIRHLIGVASPLEQALAILVGVHPRIYVLPDRDNREQLERMSALRWTLALLAAALFSLLASLVWLATRVRRLRLQDCKLAFERCPSVTAH